MVTRFGLGFAPDSWESLANAMRRKGYSDQEMFEAGLVKHGKSGGVYDAFRNRLMFPVIDVRGSVIGFFRPHSRRRRAEVLKQPRNARFQQKP